MQQGGQDVDTGGIGMSAPTSSVLLAAAEVGRLPRSPLAPPLASLHEVRLNIIWDLSVMLVI